LVGPSGIAQPGAVIDIHAKDDILDEVSNPRAQHVEQLMEQADANRRKSIMDTVNAARNKAVADAPEIGEIGDEQLRSKHPHFKTKPSLTEERRQQALKTTMTAARQADKMELAQSGNDLSVASLSQLANRHESPIDQVSPNEVVISLH